MNQIKLIQNEYFLTESSLAEYIKCDALPRLSFQNCKFGKVDFVGNVFGSCSFKDCVFKYLNARKATVTNCSFENCKIINSDMTRAEFDRTHFEKCEFLGSDLAASYFYNCTCKETKFLECNLDLIGITDVKIWESQEWVKIEEDLSSFEKHFGQ